MVDIEGGHDRRGRQDMASQAHTKEAVVETVSGLSVKSSGSLLPNRGTACRGIFRRQKAISNAAAVQSGGAERGRAGRITAVD